MTRAKSAASVRREPFAGWLKEKVDANGIGIVAERIGMSERRVRVFLQGYDTAGKNRVTGSTGKLRPVDFVSLDLVDRSLMNWGEPPNMLDELYPLD